MSALLRDEITQVAHSADFDRLDRSMMVVAILSEALRPLAVEPVLVGGMAVLYWTQIDEFMTVDIDLVMDDSPAVDDVLLGLGFSRAKNGRHWHIPGSEVFLELPDRRLEPAGAEFEVVSFDDGRQARVLSQIDVLLGRVLELTSGPREDMTLQALALIAGITDRERLMQRARQVDEREKVTAVAEILGRLIPVADRVASGEAAMPDRDAMSVLVRGSE